jgi:nucleoside-diphosphate-sugar epimerase
MNVLITGGSGFLGSVLVNKLMADPKINRIYNVDAQFFGSHCNDNTGKYMHLNRRVELNDWDAMITALDVTSVISLAALSNDPACELNPVLTKTINHFSVTNLAYECKRRSIPLIFASSCAVYGAVNYAASESSPMFPISVYAREKMEVERDLWEMADDTWQPRIFRMATLYGVSPRMRFDLAVNLMVRDALVNKVITVNGGNQWRPFIHVDSAARCYQEELKTCRKLNNGFIVNLGDFNITIKGLADIVASRFTDVTVVSKDSMDSRNYRLKDCYNMTSDMQSVQLDTLTKNIDSMIEYVKNMPNTTNDMFYTVKQLRKVL